MIFDWFARCDVSRLEYVVCAKGETIAMARIWTHPTDADFLVVSGPAIASGEVVVPWMELDRDYGRDRFEQYVLRTLWSPNGDNLTIAIEPFCEHQARNLESHQAEDVVDPLEE